MQGACGAVWPASSCAGGRTDGQVERRDGEGCGRQQHQEGAGGAHQGDVEGAQHIQHQAHPEVQRVVQEHVAEQDVALLRQVTFITMLM